MLGHMLPMTIVVLSHMMSISPSAAAPHNLFIPLPIVSSQSFQLEQQDEASPMDLQIIRRDEKSYDDVDNDDQTGSSWEESTASIIDRRNHENNHPWSSLQHPIIHNKDLMDAANAIMIATGVGGYGGLGGEESGDESDSQVMTRNVNVINSPPEIDREDNSNLIRMNSFNPTAFHPLKRQYPGNTGIVSDKIGQRGHRDSPIHQLVREWTYNDEHKGTDAKDDEDEESGEGGYGIGSGRSAKKLPYAHVSSGFWVPSSNSPQENYNHENDGTDPAAMLTFIPRNEKRSPKCLRRCMAQGLLHPSQCHSLC